MRPNAAYTPKVVATPFHNQVIELAVFSPPPFASAEEERLNKLCPVRTLRCYAERTRAFRQSDQLFVCFGARAKGRPLSKPSLSRWIVEAIVLSYNSLSLDPLYAGGLVFLGLTIGRLSGRYLQSCKLEFSPHFH